VGAGGLNSPGNRFYRLVPALRRLRHLDQAFRVEINSVEKGRDSIRALKTTDFTAEAQRTPSRPQHKKQDLINHELHEIARINIIDSLSQPTDWPQKAQKAQKIPRKVREEI